MYFFHFQLDSIVEKEYPFLFPRISICAEPYQNIAGMKQLGIGNDDAWNLFKYRTLNNFSGWPITNSANGKDIWETTTFGFHDMIGELSMRSYNEADAVDSSFNLKESIGWLDIKVIMDAKYQLMLRLHQIFRS